MNQIESYTRTAFYYETDRMDIIHHSNYIRWFEEARIDFMEKIGYSYKRVEELGIMSPVLFVDCQYKSPVRFGETVKIYVTQPFFNGVRVEFSYRVESADTGKLHATGKSGHCFVNGKFQPISLKKDYPEVYEAYSKYTETGNEKKR